jgi:hypothetical protein
MRFPLAETRHGRIGQLDSLLGGLGKVESALRNEADELAFEADRQAKRPCGKPLSVDEVRSRFPDATDGEVQAAAASKKLILPNAAATREIEVAVAAVRWLRQLTEARRRTSKKHSQEARSAPLLPASKVGNGLYKLDPDADYDICGRDLGHVSGSASKPLRSCKKRDQSQRCAQSLDRRAVMGCPNGCATGRASRRHIAEGHGPFDIT